MSDNNDSNINGSAGRPTAPGPGGAVPRFGMYAGPNYAGGQAWGKGQMPSAQAWQVRPIGFLDDVTRTHDINYTYIEQTYRGSDAAAQAAKTQAFWQADKEMLANMLGYQPRNWLEGQYRSAAVHAFVAKADMSYGKHVDVVGEWNQDLAGIDPKFPAMPVTESGRADWNPFGLAHAGATYTSTGMEALSTSGVNGQVAMLFNQHIRPGNIAAHQAASHGDSHDPQAAQDYSRRIMVPQRDPVHQNIFTAEGYINGKWVTIRYDSRENELVRAVHSGGQRESVTTYSGAPDPGSAGREYGHANFTVTRQNYVNGEPAGDPVTLPPVKADDLPALAESRHTQGISGLVTQGEAAVYPSAPTEEDRAWQRGDGSLFPAPAGREAGAEKLSRADGVLPPALAGHFAQAEQDIGGALRSAGFSGEQAWQVCAAAVGHCARHPSLGPPDRFMLSRDEQQVGVLHGGGMYLSEMPIDTAMRQGADAHLSEVAQRWEALDSRLRWNDGEGRGHEQPAHEYGGRAMA